MSALEESTIKNFWVATGLPTTIILFNQLSSTIGEFPLLNKQFPDDGLDVVEDLLTGAEIEFHLMQDVAYSRCAHFYNLVHCGPVFTLEWFSPTLSKDATLTLLYYAGYLTMTVCYFYRMVLSILISAKANGRFKIPNSEVMMDWARWCIADVESYHDVLKTCVEGPVSDFTTKWPNFMQQQLDPKLVGKARGAASRKTAERIYHVFFWGLMQSLRAKGWEVCIERGSSYVDIRLHHRRKRKAVLIELKSSEQQGNMVMERDANKALKQIEEKNYQNSEGLPNIRTLREYGIAVFHLDSYVKGRYLELDGQNEWVEKDDPMMSVS
jgi:PD-(D/E)XK nuclease superfamily